MDRKTKIPIRALNEKDEITMRHLNIPKWESFGGLNKRDIETLLKNRTMLGVEAYFEGKKNMPMSRRIQIVEKLKNIPQVVYKIFMETNRPSCSGDNQRRFITPNKRTKHESKKVQPPLGVPISSRFTVLETTENTEISVEKTEPQQIQENNHMETQDVTSNTTSEVKKPPPIVIREKKIWPNINDTLKNLGIKSVKNFNTRDGIGSQAQIRNITQICDIEVRFEHQRKKRRIGQCYNCQCFEHSAHNCKAEPVCRHCAGNHESRAHNMDDVGPNKCGNCEGPHNSNYRGCPDFPISEKKDSPASQACKTTTQKYRKQK
ncbi:hypothetical protein JTB14_016492 [Gonioctena quinquepunctata]|nr:hypothetical protein JTB14_016492 [Gonioctena quinquepunctata]